MNQSQTPLVSVVIPTFNRRHLICETLTSVFSQTYRHLEVIVVDDGSTDGTQELVLSKYSSDYRLRYIYQQNAERAAARNRGILESRGQYIGFLDSDDLWHPDKLEMQVSALCADNTAACCYCLNDVIGPDGSGFGATRQSPPDGDIFGPLLNDCFIGSMTPLINRRCFDELGGFCQHPGLVCFEDWEMWTRLACRYRWVLVPHVLGSHRMHVGNTQHAADLAVDELRMTVMQRYPLPQAKSEAVRNYITARRWHWATQLWRDHPSTTLQLLSRIAVCDPHWLLRRNFWGLVVRSGVCTLQRSQSRSPESAKESTVP